MRPLQLVVPLVLALAAAVPLSAETAAEWRGRMDAREAAAERDAQNRASRNGLPQQESPGSIGPSAPAPLTPAERHEQAKAAERAWQDEKDAAAYRQRELQREVAEERAAAKAAEQARIARERQWHDTTVAARRTLERAEPASPDAEQAVADLRRLRDEQWNDAIASYAWLQARGRFVPAEPVVARAELKRAIDRGGSGMALSWYATCLEEGIGGAVDEVEARVWYRAHAAQPGAGIGYPCRRLGAMAEAGRVAPVDLDAAIAWYRRAGEAGDQLAQVRLAEMRLAGTGMAAQPATARAQLEELAASSDADVAAAARTALARP